MGTTSYRGRFKTKRQLREYLNNMPIGTRVIPRKLITKMDERSTGITIKRIAQFLRQTGFTIAEQDTLQISTWVKKI